LIKKAILPVAGLGTRFLPATKAIPKEMLPIIDKPLIQYAVEEAIEVGINEIIFITSPDKFSIKNHFKKNKNLESKLIKSNKNEILDKLDSSTFSKVKFYYINQYDQKGLGHAILQAESIIKKNPFAVLLPDDLFISSKPLGQLLEIYNKKKSSVISVNRINKANIHKYGVIKKGIEEDGIIKIDDIVEKPYSNEAPSDLAVCGRYILNGSIFEHLKVTEQDRTGEIQLTDAIKSLLSQEEIFASIFDGKKYDCGSKEGFIHANIALALEDKSIAETIKTILKEIV
tara:strand:+ start:37 stop:894 length:858 start_codon:yes stop_codon:yes gene_type:complete